ncbi:MAG: sugar ABC transporter permease [Sumerlaeia bacterium]
MRSSPATEAPAPEGLPDGLKLQPAPPPPRRGLSPRAQQILVAYGFLLPALAVVGIFQFYPIIQSLFSSFYEYGLADPGGGEYVGLGNYDRLLHDANFWAALKNSLLYLLVVPLIIGLSLMLAALVEPKVPFIGFFRACYYVPVITTMVVVALVWKYLFRTDGGLINEWLVGSGLLENGVPWLVDESYALWTVMSVTIWKGLGYYMILFLVALKAIPKELMEAARIDGANPVQTFFAVKVPLLWPTISLVSVLSSISAIQVFEEIWIMTSGRSGTATLVVEIYRYGFEGFGRDLGYGCAMGVVLFGVVMAFTLVALRLMPGALKNE